MAGNESRREHAEAVVGHGATTGGSFVDTLALFLRTVPIYADGHRRLTSVAERLSDVLAGSSADLVLDVTPEGLALDGVAVTANAAHAKSVRESLDATAIARVTFFKGAPMSSFTFFARALGRNARLAANGHLTFQDLWGAPIEGIRVQEQVYDSEAFVGGGEAPDAPRLASIHGDGDRGVVGTGSGTSDSAKKATDTGDGGGTATSGTAASSQYRILRTVAKELRELIRTDPTVGSLLERLEGAVLAQEGAAAVGGKQDLLEQILSILPIEARLDPAKGLRVVQKILERFASEMVDAQTQGASGGVSSRAAMLIHAMRAVFPARSKSDAAFPLSPTAEPAALPVEPAPDPAEELELLNRISMPLPGETVRDGAEEDSQDPAPCFDADPGIRDLGGVLTQAMLAEIEPQRREAARKKLVVHLVSQKSGGGAVCVEIHLREALSAPTGNRDLERIRLLASVLEDAGLSAGGAASAFLSPELLVALFPRLLPTHLAEGGNAGLVGRAVGREAILAAAPALLGRGGALTAPLVDRVLAERSRDVLPFLEVLADCGERATVARVARALRAVPNLTPSAVLLSVLPEGRATPELLRVLCQDGFSGVDSHRIDAAAVAAIADIVTGPARSSDKAARAYATAALSAFPRELAEPILKHLVRRRWLIPIESAAVRRNARNILKHYAASGPAAAAVPASFDYEPRDPTR